MLRKKFPCRSVPSVHRSPHQLHDPQWLDPSSVRSQCTCTHSLAIHGVTQQIHTVLSLGFLESDTGSRELRNCATDFTDASPGMGKAPILLCARPVLHISNHVAFSWRRAYLLPSASKTFAPLTLSKMMGCPPTDLKALTGLFTPPGRSSKASLKIYEGERR